MYTKNPYEGLIINPSNQAKVVPYEQTQQNQYVQYASQYQIQQHQIMISQACQFYPQIETNPQINNLNLIKYSTHSEKKKFMMKVVFIGLIQQTIMFLAVLNCLENQTLKTIFYKNNVIQWPYYLLIIITITSTLLCRFLKPTKDYFLQGVILVGMTVLYIFSAQAVTIVLYYNSYWFKAILFSQSLALLSILVILAIQSNNERMFIKFIAVQFFLVVIPVIIILFCFHPKDEYGQLGLFIVVIFALGLIILVWSLCFGILFLYSIEQLNNGKFNLKRADFASASIIVYGNMLTPVC